MASNLFLTMGSVCIARGLLLNISYRILEYQNFDQKIINGKLNGQFSQCIYLLLEVSDSGMVPCSDKMHGADCKKSLQNYICILDGMGWAGWLLVFLYGLISYLEENTELFLFFWSFSLESLSFVFEDACTFPIIVEDFPVHGEDRQKYDLQLIKLAHDVFSLRQIQELIAGPPQSCVWRQVLSSSVILSGLRDPAPPHCGLPVPAHYHFYLPTIPKPRSRPRENRENRFF